MYIDETCSSPRLCMMASPTLPTVWEVVQALARGRGGAREARVSTSGSSIALVLGSAV